jgi:phenylpropionate dioxygenase-like ring-hydroxylating dioxygenase large terminal subunit
MSYRAAVLPCNWKTAAEAFEESYHLLGTHPQQLVGVDDVNTSYATTGPHSIMVLPFGRPSPRLSDITEEEALQCFLEMVINVGSAGEDQLAALEMFKATLDRDGLPEGVTAREVFVNLVKAQVGDRLPDLSDEQLSFMPEYTVFPNTVISCLPGQTAVIRTRPNGTDPDSCIFEFISLHLFGEHETPPLVRPEWLDDPVRDGWPDSLEATQDMQNLPKIQAGMHARPFVRLAGYQEMKIIHRHRVLDEYLGSR